MNKSSLKVLGFFLIAIGIIPLIPYSAFMALDIDFYMQVSGAEKQVRFKVIFNNVNQEGALVDISLDAWTIYVVEGEYFHRPPFPTDSTGGVNYFILDDANICEWDVALDSGVILMSGAFDYSKVPLVDGKRRVNAVINLDSVTVTYDVEGIDVYSYEPDEPDDLDEPEIPDDTDGGIDWTNVVLSAILFMDSIYGSIMGLSSIVIGFVCVFYSSLMKRRTG